ncbi:MAG: hypothetical protein E4H14_07670 [Candidatus Thorarchaeota archaeon]|nr:MAG: hypothetical protein E4H14_07670 [Candidatus Thorarchaeota archaeon]
MLKLHEGRYSKVSFLVIFVIAWVVIFAISHYGTITMPYDQFLFQTVIFSTLIAFPIACCCFYARGGARDHRELTGGPTVVGI